ncbi:hypothetical protein JD844_016118 [Phrynosoma platyrhinos]|uniref:Centrosome and spindle pole-associated protein 1 C-terminal domain-containing protein n=1 Tax=Phrynosoma platyrhinos TaxID=52577 RepID=A0ABQ7SK76_PHRPL|nr:hypothetical protein JD844_016118 [Phrynosoma platyrhinos]
MMAEDLDQFLEEQKAKLAEDKAKLENDPPYMEMQNKSTEKLSESSKKLISMAKENIPPNSQQTDYGLSLPLGEEYEQKKHKLKEELRQDYRRYLSQKKYLTSGEVDPYTQGLSLPIGDRRSAKDRLRLERNKEYNQYLREKEEWNERLKREEKSHIECDTDTYRKSTLVTRKQPELHMPLRRDEESLKKDAYTSTETYEGLSNSRSLLDQHHRPDNEIGCGDSVLHKKLAEKLNISNQKHQKLDGKSCISPRRLHIFDHDPEINDEMDPRFRYESDYDKKPLRVFHPQKSQNYSLTNEQLHSAQYATGLIIGGQDRELIQRRKEQYRQELMEQIAEQQRNKRREKELELPVAASGALDPEKMLSEEKPNRLRELGLTTRIPEERIPPEKPRPAFQTPTPGPTSISAPPISPVNEDFHRGLSTTLGEIIVPLPPPEPPPILTDNYRTPYDDAYYFYGARNPLDPNLAYYGTGKMGMQPSSAPPPVSAVHRYPAVSLSKIGAKVMNDRSRGLGVFPEEKSKSTRDSTLTYQQELQQQIREREERRRLEKEERERYDAKLEAEMRSYNPWGKGGGGAPLRDKKGNLITDLNMMHKQNEDAYHNPEARVYEDKRAIVSVDLNFTYTQVSPFARGNVFGEAPTPEQLRRQESYKNFLRFQIEEKRKREEEEREKRRLEEEKEERRLADQRARIQREYEEELERKRRKEEEQRLKNEELYRLAEERRKEAEKKKLEEEERQDKQNNDIERHIVIEEEKISRQPSPLIPSLQNKPLVKEERSLLMEKERKNVINELSEMRKQLRSEERRLQEELLKAHSDDDDDLSAKGRKNKCYLDVFEMARLRMQAPVRRPSSKEVADPINVQNIREFNELKYKDSDTRVETRYMYPDPPTNDDALDIQQQALLREQKKKLKKMRRNAEAVLDFDDLESGYKSRRRGMVMDDESNEFMKNSLLESESAFIATDGEAFPPLEVHKTPPPLSARERRREKKKDDAPLKVTPPPQSDGSSLRSNSSLNIDQLKARNEEQLQRLNELRKKASHIADDISLGNADDILKELPSRDVRRSNSVDTVATEPWLRPGTSETLKRFMSEQSSQAKLSSEKNVLFNWQGLSTAHG